MLGALSSAHAQGDLGPTQRMVPESFPSPARRKLFGHGGAYASENAHGGPLPSSSNVPGGEPAPGDGAARAQQGSAPAGGQPVAQPGGTGGGSTATSTAHPGAGCAGTGAPVASTSQAARDVRGRDQLNRPIRWADASPMVRKAVQMLYEMQAADDTAVLEEVDDPAPYLAGADPVDEVAVPDAV